MNRHIRFHPSPLAIAAIALTAAAFLGRGGLVVAVAGLVAGGILWRARVRTDRRLLLADYVERHSFASDTIEDFAKSETGTTSIEAARARMDAWRSGYVAAEWDARARRSASAKQAAATRRARSGAKGVR